MPWQEVSTVALREEFVALAQQQGVNLRALCRRFQISPTTGYKWLQRAQQGLPLSDRSRCPKHSPMQCAPQLELQVCALRQQHPAWGARKLAQRLRALNIEPAAVSTVHAILRRNGLITPAASHAAAPWQRFEHPQPNDLWQMDFKGHVALRSGARCHPLTILDDHSRYALCLHACADEQEGTVRQQLQAVMRRYGVPARMTMDNGSPWGSDQRHYTSLDVWLMRQGIRVSHSRPYHPQTQGKDERFHRTLKAEVLQGAPLADLQQAQAAFERWRGIYNQQRPHQALGMCVPLQRYRPSERTYCEHPAAPEYSDTDQVCKVQDQGRIAWQGRNWRVGKAFIGEPVAVRANDALDGVHDVFWSTWRIARINLHSLSVCSGRIFD
jgi:transposase InsO family protein